MRHAEGAEPMNSLPREDMSPTMGAGVVTVSSSEVASPVVAVGEDSAVDSEEEAPASDDDTDPGEEFSSSGCEEVDEGIGEELSSSGWDEDDDAE